MKRGMKPRRVLMSVSDKTGIVDLARAFIATHAEIIATGNTAKQLVDAGIPVTPIEKVTGLPEAFQGRMKTLSFHVCSGILYRRGNEKDEKDLRDLNILPIDAVVVNFYPFEKAVREKGDLIENIDIGGPTLVRAAAKNADNVLVLTDPSQYDRVIEDLRTGELTHETMIDCARHAWTHVEQYDIAIAREFGSYGTRQLRYGENPHQTASLQVDADSPIDWNQPLTATEISYNNILDLSHAYELASELIAKFPAYSSVVIVKHNNPCGVATLKKTSAATQKEALLKAWEGDPVSAFGGVLVFTEALTMETAEWLSERFVELIAAPELSKNSVELQKMLLKRKNLKALSIRRFEGAPKIQEIRVPGGKLTQSYDHCEGEKLESVTKVSFPTALENLGHFGIRITKQLKSNAIALVREIPGGYQLVGAGQGQPNRIEALKWLAIPRACGVLETTGGELAKCVMISDAFFPFRDTVETARDAGIRYIIQPGGSMKDKDSVASCDEAGIAMAFTGRRHFRH